MRFRLTARPPGVVNCHCGQCRRFHGAFGAYASVPRAAMILESGAALVWYQSSAKARRGFCGTCGSSLFWDGFGRADIDVSAGALDQPTGLAALRHIHTADRADFYAITDGLEQR